MEQKPVAPRRTPPSQDLPPVLQRFFNPPAVPTMQGGAGLASAMMQTGITPGAGKPLPSFQTGGMVGPGGTPMGPGAVPGGPGVQAQQPQAPMDPQMLDMNIQEFVANNPQQVQQIQQAIQQAIQSGELTPDMLNTVIQLATAAIQNPSLYPQLRQFAIQQGFATEADISPQFDAGLVYTILIAAKAMQNGTPQSVGGASPAPAGPVGQSFAGGGEVQGRPDAPVPINAHEGEYVIPKHVVEMKGKEFFDSLIEKYADRA